MTTLEFIEKQLDKAQRNLNSAIKQGTDPIGIENLKKKVAHYTEVVEVLKKIV